MLKIAVDVGFGRVKGYSSLGKAVDFPSVIGEFHPVQFISGFENDPASNLVIGYNQKRYFVGISALKQSLPQATVDKNRTITEEGLILLMGALSIMLPEKTSESGNLIVGLPVMHYNSLKDKYISSIKQTHLIELLSLTGQTRSLRYFSIQAVKVLPQPIGTLFDCLLNDAGEIKNTGLASSKIGIIDIGYNTLDLAWIDNLDFVSLYSTSFSGLGIFSAYQNLAREIYQKFSIEVPVEHIESLIRKGDLNIAGRPVSIETLKRKAFEETAKQIISRIKSYWPNRWNLDQIIISGGGAVLLGDYLSTEFQQSCIAPNPMHANAAGYLKFGTRVWK